MRSLRTCRLAWRRTGRRSVRTTAILRLMSGRRMVRWGVLRAWATCGSVRTRLPRNAGTGIPTLRLLRHRIRLWMIRLPATIVAGTEARSESRKKGPAAVLADEISNSDQQYHTTDRHTDTDGNALSMRQVVIRAVEVVITVIHGDQETPVPTRPPSPPRQLTCLCLPWHVADQTHSQVKAICTMGN